LQCSPFFDNSKPGLYKVLKFDRQDEWLGPPDAAHNSNTQLLEPEHLQLILVIEQQLTSPQARYHVTTVAPHLRQH
jgi:hypothetical protein